MTTFSENTELRQAIRNDVPGLVEAVKFWNEYDSQRGEVLRENASPEARKFLNEYGEKRRSRFFKCWMHSHA